MPTLNKVFILTNFAATALIFWYFALHRRKKLKEAEVIEEKPITIDVEEEILQSCVSQLNSPTTLSKIKNKPVFLTENYQNTFEKLFDSVHPMLETLASVSAATVTIPAKPVVGMSVLDICEESELRTLKRFKNIESCSDGTHTPESVEETVYSPTYPQGCFDDPANNIEELKPELCNGKLLPRVSIPSDIWAEAVEQNVWHETFMIPAHMGGVLIGRFGKNVRELKTNWQAEFSLSLCPGRQDTLIFKLSCPIENRDHVMNWVTRRFHMRPSKTPIGNPNQLRRFLPLGIPTKVHVRSLYGLKDFFVSIHDSDYDRFVEMQLELDKDYSSISNFRMQLCAPVTSGTVAILPHNHGFARALILKVLTNSKHALYFLLDYGTFGVVKVADLRKIKARYMQTRFQAIHVTWAHAWPVFSDLPDLHVLRTLFSSGRVLAQAVRMETCCKASVAFAESPPTQRGEAPESQAQPHDLLASACRSGLYLVSPLYIYASRQIWLNGTQYPYYLPLHTDLDYSGLVSFAVENPEMNGTVALSVPGNGVAPDAHSAATTVYGPHLPHQSYQFQHPQRRSGVPTGQMPNNLRNSARRYRHPQPGFSRRGGVVPVSITTPNTVKSGPRGEGESQPMPPAGTELQAARINEAGLGLVGNGRWFGRGGAAPRLGRGGAVRRPAAVSECNR